MQIRFRNSVRVKHSVNFSYEDLVPGEAFVSFVPKKQETVVIDSNTDGVSDRDLAVILQVFLVRPD